MISQRVEADGLVIELQVDIASLDLVAERSAQGPAGDAAADVEAELARVEEELLGVDGDIEALTSQSDRLDVGVAVASGVLVGVIDSLWVGELSLERGRAWGTEVVNRAVKEAARRYGYRGDDLAGAIRRLEAAAPFAGDRATYPFGGGRVHHIRDLSHHPSPVGLAASIVMQFTGQAWGISKDGLVAVDVAGDGGLIGKTVPEKLFFGTVRWCLHLLSDAAGSSRSPGAGAGLPGPLVSMLHEAATLFDHLGSGDGSDLMAWVERAFRGGGGRDAFDLRAEIGVAGEFSRQSLPVLLNDALVRGFYFVRRMVAAIRVARPRSLRELVEVDVAPAMPWGNRTVVRMLTIATTTATAVDLADAAVRAALKTGAQVETPAFWIAFVLRVNVVGLARTTVAIGVDVRMGAQRARRRDARIALMTQRLHLLNARSSYRLGGMWTAAEDATMALQVTERVLAEASIALRRDWAGMRHAASEISAHVGVLAAADPELTRTLADELEWGTRGGG